MTLSKTFYYNPWKKIRVPIYRITEIIRSIYEYIKWDQIKQEIEFYKEKLMYKSDED